MATRRRRFIVNPDDEDYGDYEFDEASKINNEKIIDPPPEEISVEESLSEDAKPVGNVMKVSVKGGLNKSYYEAFEFNGIQYMLDDSVCMTQDQSHQEPYVAIIKEITRVADDSMMVLVQWFYRPEEAEKKGGGRWVGRDARELFYSFHQDEVPAESVIHKCQAHFVPLHKKVPDESLHPGFIVQNVYDTVEKKLFELTDKDYEDGKQHEIDLLMQKTLALLGDLPDLPATEDVVVGSEEQIKDSRGLKRKAMAHLDVKRDRGSAFRAEQRLERDDAQLETSEAIIAKFGVSTENSHRDVCLAILLESLRSIFDSNSDSKGIVLKDSSVIPWPDAAVSVVVGLEEAANNAFDGERYTKKMRQLLYNLKRNTRLLGQLMNGELEPSVVVHMKPKELKDGLTTKETTPNEPEVSPRMGTTDVPCRRCEKRAVVLIGIVQGGDRGDRYHLKCRECGDVWSVFRDEISTLSMDNPSS